MVKPAYLLLQLEQVFDGQVELVFDKVNKSSSKKLVFVFKSIFPALVKIESSKTSKTS